MRETSRKLNMRDRRRKRNSVWKRVVSAMALIAVFCTVYALVLPAITLSEDPICGQQPHEHTEACYRTEIRVPNCVAQSHIHTASCFSEVGERTCGLISGVNHVHDETCFKIIRLDETELICSLPEHIHVDACFLDTSDLPPVRKEFYCEKGELTTIKVLVGDASFYQMQLLLGGEPHELPEGAKTAVKVDFRAPVFTSEEMVGATKVETFLLTQEDAPPANLLNGTVSAEMSQTLSSGQGGTSEETVESELPLEIYQVEQVQEDTYENASEGLTGVVFESDMVTTFAVVHLLSSQCRHRELRKLQQQ